MKVFQPSCSSCLMDRYVLLNGLPYREKGRNPKSGGGILATADWRTLL